MLFRRSRQQFGRNSRGLILCATAALNAAVPQSFIARFPDLNAADTARLLAADSTGNLFVVSTSAKTSAITNIHVIKTDPTGAPIASYDFGGSGVDTPAGAATDPQGNLILVGYTTSQDFPLVSPAIRTGGGFAVKLDGSLHGILFSTRLGTTGGGPFPAGGSAVTTDTSGNIYLAGSTTGAIATTPGVIQPAPPALQQVSEQIEHGFVMELSSSGDRVVFATHLTGAAFTCFNGQSTCTVYLPPFTFSPPVITTTPTAIAVDSIGAVVVAANTNSSGLPVTQGSYSGTCGCTNSVLVPFIAHISGSGTHLDWGTYVPLTTTNSQDAGSVLGVPVAAVSALSLDATGDVVFAGRSLAGFPVMAGGTQTTFPGTLNTPYAGYVAKLDRTGSRLLFSTWLGATPPSHPSGGPAALAVDSAGAIAVTGSAAAGSLPAGSAPPLGENYIANLTPDGSAVSSLFTTPAGMAGLAIQAAGPESVAALGASGALMISSTATAPSLLGITAAPAFTASGAVAPREMVALYGTNIGPAQAVTATPANGQLPRSLGGVQVLFDGHPAALLYAGPTQINAIVPAAIAGQLSTSLSMMTATGPLNGPVLAVRDAAPAVFTNADGFAFALNQDGSVNTPTNQALPGSVVSFWFTGGGAFAYSSDGAINSVSSLSANPLAVSVLVPGPAGMGMVSAEVLYAGDAPAMPSGVIQVNFRIPEWLHNLSVQLQVGDALAAPLELWVK